MAVRRRQAKKAGPRKQLKAWSYSTWNMWRICPQRIFYSKIERLPDPLGKAAQRGTEVHGIAEEFVAGKIDELPTRGNGKILIPFKPDLIQLRDEPTVKVEVDFTFTETWRKTHWRDWNDAWVRMKIDVLYRPEPGHVVLLDYKTGRKRDYAKQTEIYALGCFTAHKSAEKVTTEIWFLDHPNDDDAITSFDFGREEMGTLQAEWERRVKPMMEDTVYRPSPGNDCSWCPFSKKKGGPCEAG